MGSTTTGPTNSAEAFSVYQLDRIGCAPNETLRTAQLRVGFTYLGRNISSDVVTMSTFASREHCRISVTGDKVEVFDENSFNGTFVNERRVQGSKMIRVGDLVGIGCGLVDIPTLQSSRMYIVFQLNRSDIVEISDDDLAGSVESASHIERAATIDDDRGNDAVQSVDDDDSDDDDELFNVNMSQRFHAEMKQEVLDLDDHLWDLENNSDNVHDKPDEIPAQPIDIDREDSQSPSSMLYLQQLNTDRGGSPSLFDSSDLPDDVDEEFAPNSPDDCCIVISDEHDQPTAADDMVLNSWMQRLSQRSDSGCRALMIKSERADDKDDDERTITSVAKRSHDNAIPSTSSGFTSTESPSLAKKMKQCSVFVEPLPDCFIVDKPSRVVAAAEDERTITDVPAPLPALDAVSRLQNFLKRRPSVCERPIQVIEAPPQPKRRQSISAARPAKKSSLTKVKHSAKVDNLKESFKSAKPASSTRTDRHKSDDERKAKLRELAEANRKSSPEVARISVKPKVKVTHNSRGAFLAEDVSLPPIPKRRPETTSDRKKTEAKIPKKPQASKEVRRPECTPLLPAANQTKANIEPKTKTSSSDSTIGGICKQSTSKDSLEDVENTERTKLITAQHTKHRTQHSTKKPTAKNESSSVIKPADKPQKRITTDADEQNFVVELAKFKVTVSPLPTSVRSILRRCGTVRSQKRSLRFAENMCQYRDHVGVATTDVPIEATATTVDPMHELIGDITGWDPGWLQQPSEMAAVNRADYVPKSMKHNYEDFASYLQTLVPLMKMELWQVIYRDYSMQKSDAPMNVTVSGHQHSSDRYKIQCEMAALKYRLLKNHLVLVSFAEGKSTVKFLAMVTQSFTSRPCSANPKTTTYFTLETSNGLANGLNAATLAVQLQVVAQLNFEMKSFGSILQLQVSPLLKAILRPSDFPIGNMDVERMPYEYRGPDKLNDKQAQIVRQICFRWAQQTSSITLIDGPPGTGKSRLITNLLLQFINGHIPSRPRTILLCAHSNAAVDVICRRLLTIRQRMKTNANYITGRLFSLVRFGVPSRMHADIKSISLELLARRPVSLNDLEKEKNFYLQRLNEKRAASTNNQLQRERDLRFFGKRLDLVQKTIDNFKSNTMRLADEYHLGTADIICTTLNSCVKLMGNLNLTMDICIVDEATQCTEPSTLLPLQLGVRSLVLVGDTHQLHGTVLSRQAANLGLERSLFDRIQNAFTQPKQCPVYGLCRQYRMHPDICDWPNRHFYGGRLVTDAVAVDAAAKCPLRPYTVFNLPYTHAERINPMHEIRNEREADFIVRMLKALAPIVGAKYSIGIITPYAQQQTELGRKLTGLPLKYLSVNTIDSYQGQEKDIIIISTTRSTGIGFLGISQRLNVALTRARKCLILCGNFKSLQNRDVWNALLSDAAKRNCYRDVEHIVDEEKFRKRIIDDLVKSELQNHY